MEKTGYTPEPAAKTEAQLEDELQAKMDELNDEQGVEEEDLELDEEPQDDDPADDVEDAEESTLDDDEPADETDDDDEPTPEDTEGDSTPDDEEGIDIPDAHYRAAIHQGWTADEIEELVDLNPDKAKKIFAKFHETTNKISQEFARIGRVELKPDEKVEENVKPAIDIDALKKEHGDDNPLVGAIDQLQQQVLDFRAEQPAETAPAPVDDTLTQAVDVFFNSDGMTGYNEHYGEGMDYAKLTHEQWDHRWSVLNTADQIIAGAAAQGQKMELAQALNMAHMLETKDVQEQVIRKKITSQIVKRSKGLSLKPKSSKKIESSKPKTEADLEAKTALRMSKIMS